jgi:hypothetical protein
LSGGGFQVALKGQDNELYTVGTAGSTGWDIWLAANTSPSIAALSGGGFQVALHGQDGELYTVSTAGSKGWDIWLAPNTSPNIDT